MVQHTMHPQEAHNTNNLLDVGFNKSNQHNHVVNQPFHNKSFFQLTGHKECFKPGTKSSTILKLSTGNEEKCLKELTNDCLAPFVPKLIGTFEEDGHEYLEMENLLSNFHNACVMDVKMGCRTYQEEELNSALKEKKLRPDMYVKMIDIDNNEPTTKEREAKAITKPRYMVWRETVSSTASLSFRIEAMRLSDGNVDKDFKLMKKEDQIVKALMRYAKSHKIRLKYLNRLYNLKHVLMQSKFFWRHEIIGSSLLFVHDDDEANVWMIDFAKTRSLTDDLIITHRKKWEIGNHEDGYLNGIENLIRIFESTIICETLEHFPNQLGNQKKNPDDKVNRTAMLSRININCHKNNNSLNGTSKRLFLS